MVRNTTQHNWPFPETGDSNYDDTLDDFVDLLDEEVVIKGTLSNRPPAGIEERWYLAKDEPKLYYDNGTSWNELSGSGANEIDISDDAVLVTTHPADINFGSDLAVSEDGDGTITVNSTATAGGSTGTSLYDWSTFVFENASGDYEVWRADGTQITTSSVASTALQSGIDNAAAGETIHISGHFSLGSQITIGGGKKLRGYNAEIEVTAASIWMIVVQGTEEETTAISADVTAPENFVSVTDASTFSRGDTVLVQNLSETWGDGTNGGNIGEVHLVKDVDTVNDVIELHEGVYYDYPSADTTQVVRYTPDEAHFEGFKIYGTDETPQGSDYQGILADMTTDCSFRNLTMEYLSQYNIGLRKSYGCVVEGCLIQHSINAGDGYGIRIREGTANTLVTGNRFRNVRHHIMHAASGGDDGQPRGTFAIGNHSTPSEESSCYDAHDGTISFYIVGNHIQGSDVNAIQSGAKETYILSNTIKGTDLRTEDEGGFFRTTGDFTTDRILVIRNNTVTMTHRHAMIFIDIDRDFRTIDISNNYFADIRDRAILLRTLNTDYLAVSGNTIDGSNESAVSALVEVETGSYHGGSFSDNNVKDYDEEMINVLAGVTTFENMSISGNHFYDCGRDNAQVLEFGQLANSVIADNTFHDPNNYLTNAIALESGTSGNLVRDNNMYIDVTTEISDNGTSNSLTGNYVQDGTGWTIL